MRALFSLQTPLMVKMTFQNTSSSSSFAISYRYHCDSQTGKFSYLLFFLILRLYARNMGDVVAIKKKKHQGDQPNLENRG